VIFLLPLGWCFLKNVLQLGDRAFLISFGIRNQIRLVTDLTGSAEELRRAVEALDQCHRSLNPYGCGSPIWTAVYTAARLKMKGVTGRKALVLLSEGWIPAANTHFGCDRSRPGR
jgi:hypothetical protein